MNGYEVARRLREHAGYDRLRLVAVTGLRSGERSTPGEEAGFDAHLVKPVNIQRLEQTIRRAYFSTTACRADNQAPLRPFSEGSGSECDDGWGGSWDPSTATARDMGRSVLTQSAPARTRVDPWDEIAFPPAPADRFVAPEDHWPAFRRRQCPCRSRQRIAMN